ncbi:MAG TPA: SH3 domain-containing protein, partial [Phototrophicaceae bacterium]|nr:SH3 domain-containing protein [Phototrophicaceae bacterium]
CDRTGMRPFDGGYIRNASEVGNAAVFSQGVIQAVDVFGLRAAGESDPFFAYNVKVCLLGLGGMMYLDATTAPREPQWLGTSSEGMYTCGLVPRAGTVVLVGGSAPVPTLSPLQELTDCRIESNVDGLRFRKSPDTTSQIIGLLVTGDTYPATARQGEWFRVRAQSADGWVNADYVTTSGNCGG